MIRIRRNRCRSWADPAAAKALSAQLADNLVQVCRGEKGLILTLTYRRAEYTDPIDLYRRQSEERHVRRFIERLANFLGESLTGCWLCKMEFQQGGWVHWHMVIRGLTYVEHAALTEIWGHGFVFVQTMKPARLRYICKYLAKGEALPAFILHEPIRSLKIIRVSPGFWGESDTQDRPDTVSTEKTETVIAGCYISIGQALANAEDSCVVQCPDTGRFLRIEQPVHEVVLELHDRNGKVLGTERGWIIIEGHTFDTLQADRRGQRRLAAAAAAAFHLTDTRNPPKRERWRWWDRVILDKIERQTERVAPIGRG